MKIRKYNSGDREALVQIWQLVFPDDPPHNAPHKLLDSKLEIDDLVFVADLKNQIAGACIAGYDGHRGWLYAVAVLPEFRRSGAGKQLVDHALDVLRELGCIKVNIQIRPDNQQVTSFYRQLGFEVEERVSMSKFLE